MALMQDKLKQADYVRNLFAVTLPFGIKFEEVLNPEYWAHTASKLHPTDRIEIMDEEGTYFAEVMVISCAKNWAKVSVLRFNELSEAIPEAKAEGVKGIEDRKNEFKIDWTQASKARVIRISDRQVIQENFPSKADAEKWLVSYLTSMA